jgi:endonuclease/exonuclease/phosphatase family metal-dependent hydrolase
LRRTDPPAASLPPSTAPVAPAPGAVASVLSPAPTTTRLSVLSANIQAGARTDRYSDYVTRPWTHVLPHREKRGNLDALAGMARGFDLVGLQEADPGSLRSGFVNQTHYLAERARFPFWSHQPNRRMGGIATSANALLSRPEPTEVIDHPLPGRIPGRGALLARYGTGSDELVVVVAHLSLGVKSRLAQLAFIAELIEDAPQAVLMGDFNCEPLCSEMQLLYRRTRLQPPEDILLSFPSWRPKRAIDHILVSAGIQVSRRWLLEGAPADHVPVAAEIEVGGQL